MKLWHGILLATVVLIMVIGGLFGFGVLPIDNPRLTAEQVISHVQVYGVPDIDLSAYIGDVASPVGQWSAVYEGNGKWRVQGSVIVNDDYHSITWIWTDRRIEGKVALDYNNLTYWDTDEKIELIDVRPPFKEPATPSRSYQPSTSGGNRFWNK